MPVRSRGRSSLTQSLDREVYQVVRKIIDERPSRQSLATVYDEIRRSNSSLNRKPKKVLEDSIERVLATIRQDNEETDSEATTSEGVRPTEVNQQQTSSNGLNRSIVGAWSATTATTGTMTSRRDQGQGESAETAAQGAIKRQVNGEPLAKQRKRAAPVTDRSPPTHVSFAHMGGIADVVSQFRQLVILPIRYPAAFIGSPVVPSRGILIHGPPGCGKTTIANAVAAELGVDFIPISAPAVVSGMSGESEKALRDLFEEAKSRAPCLVFIDEIDAITPKREGAQREMEKRIVAQLSICMDDLDLAKTDGKPVIVLAATNRPDSLDPALRRGGRFDKEINMAVPNERAREQILRALFKQSSNSSEIDFKLLARRTPGFVGADLQDLISTAGSQAIDRLLNTMQSEAEASEMHIDTSVDGAVNVEASSTTDDDIEIAKFQRLASYTLAAGSANHEQSNNDDNGESTSDRNNLPGGISIQLTMPDFLVALTKVQPSALREGFATIPSTTFASIGALSDHITELQEAIIQPILNPTLYSTIGITPSSGALLWGPPGCGKTLLAKAAANSSHANFISVKGPELLNKYVGESERAVRQVFTRARSSVPVIIFFDELDALVPRRDGTSSEASSRVVNTLLAELDGVGQSREGIYIIAATNRPDIIDPAMLRPGRLETLLYIGLPDAEGRVDILRTLCRKLNRFEWSEEMAQIARSCDGFSGADLESLLRRAGHAALRRASTSTLGSDGRSRLLGEESELRITTADFEVAKSEVRRSVGVNDMDRYETLRREWGKTA